MRSLKKSPEPASLVFWRRQNPQITDWNSLDSGVKQELQSKLCEDQASLCAVCESRVRPNGQELRIGHWVPRRGPEGDPSKTFDWQNLWGSCAEGDEAHCDVAQGSKRLSFLDPYHFPALLETLIVFRKKVDGQSGIRGVAISCRDQRGEADIGTLNLNTARLQQNREAAIRELEKRLGNTGHWTRANLMTLRQRIAREGPNGLPPYVTCVLHHLDRWIQRRSG